MKYAFSVSFQLFNTVLWVKKDLFFCLFLSLTPYTFPPSLPKISTHLLLSFHYASLFPFFLPSTLTLPVTRPFWTNLHGQNREVPGDLLAGVWALHQLPQAQHSPLLAEAPDESDRPADDRGVPRQPLPSHEGGVSQRTLPSALPGGLRGSGSVKLPPLKGKRNLGQTGRWERPSFL